MKEIKTPQELYERLHKKLLEEHDDQWQNRETMYRCDICYGLELAIRILEKTKEDIVNE